MAINFARVDNKTFRYIDLAQEVTLDDLRTATHKSIDTLRNTIADLKDQDVIFDPIDPEADDPHAVAGEEKIGWRLAHLVVHVTASSEEAAAFSSLLARGIPAKERPRYETPWREITTVAQCLQRLEESRRMRLAYLDTWPDAPQLNIYRDVSERFTEHFGPMNAPAAFLFGLRHEIGHYAQFEDVRQQALEARLGTGAAAV
jgi:hypothetical protein